MAKQKNPDSQSHDPKSLLKSLDLKSLIQLEKNMGSTQANPGRELCLILCDKSLPFLYRSLRVLLNDQFEVIEHEKECSFKVLHGEASELSPHWIIWIPHFAIDYRSSANWAREKAQEIVTLMQMYPKMRLVLPWPEPGLEWGPAGSPGAITSWNLIRDLNHLVQNEVDISQRLICTESFIYSVGYNNIYEPRWDMSVQMPWASSFQIKLAVMIHDFLQLSKQGRLKALVIALDDVLWPGTLGESPIDLSGVDPESSAFLAMQKYLLELKARGVMLLGIARAPVQNLMSPNSGAIHGLLVTEADFQAISIGGEFHGLQILDLAERTQLGLAELAYCDFDPYEFDLTRRMIPELSCLQLDLDPCLRVAQLKAQSWFWQFTAKSVPKSLKIVDVDFAKIHADLDVAVKLQPLSETSEAFVLRTLASNCKFKYLSEKVLEALQGPPSLGEALKNCFVYELEDIHGQMGPVGFISLVILNGVAQIQAWMTLARAQNRRIEEQVLTKILTELQGVERVIIGSPAADLIGLLSGIPGLIMSGEDLCFSVPSFSERGSEKIRSGEDASP